MSLVSSEWHKNLSGIASEEEVDKALASVTMSRVNQTLVSVAAFCDHILGTLQNFGFLIFHQAPGLRYRVGFCATLVSTTL